MCLYCIQFSGHRVLGRLDGIQHAVVILYYIFLDLPKDVLKGYKYAVAGTVNETGLYSYISESIENRIIKLNFGLLYFFFFPATHLKIPIHPDFKNKTGM